MHLPRLFACLLGVIALLITLPVYAEYIGLLGFPDGFITPRGFAERRLAYVFIGGSAILGGNLLYLGGFADREKLRSRLFLTTIAYLVFWITTALSDWYFHVYLMGGEGG